MRASDLMTINVITVSPEMSVQSLADLLGRYGISGVPVVDAANTLVGIVSEGDLLFRTETHEIHTERRTEPRRSRWFEGRHGRRSGLKTFSSATRLCTSGARMIDQSRNGARFESLQKTYLE
jgi:CBS-domain-containing membrane protein